MEENLLKKIAVYLQAHRKAKRFAVFACVLSVLMITGVVQALMKPAISMEIGNPALSSEDEFLEYGEESVIHVSATADDDQEDGTYFALSTKEENAYLSGLSFDRQGEATLKMDDGSDLVLHRVSADKISSHEEIEDGRVNYWFWLPQGTSQDFDLTFVSSLNEDGKQKSEEERLADLATDSDAEPAEDAKQTKKDEQETSKDQSSDQESLASPSDASGVESKQSGVKPKKNTLFSMLKHAVETVEHDLTKKASPSNASPSNAEEGADGYKWNLTDSGLSFVEFYSASSFEKKEALFAADSARENLQGTLTVSWMSWDMIEALRYEKGMPDSAISWVTVQREGLPLTSFGYDSYSVALLNDLSDEEDGIATFDDSAEEGIDFTDHITSVTVWKIVNGQWKESTEFVDGDQVKTEIHFTIPEGEVDEDNKTIYYQLPAGIRPLEEQTGIVYQKGVAVGTYTIDTDGMIKILFYDAFADGEEFDGKVEFKGTLSASGAGDDGKINFGGAAGTITVGKKDQDKTDLSITKTGTPTDDKTAIDYTIEASTKNGTKDTVTIMDSFKSGGSATGVYQEGSFKLQKKDAEGNLIDLSDQYKPTIKTEADGNKSFTYEDLPPLEAGESYVVNYRADVKSTSISGQETVQNAAGVKSDGSEDWKWSWIEISKNMIAKSGYYDANQDVINWNITVNEDHRDISGYHLKDTLPDGLDLTSDVIIRDSNGTVVATIPKSDVQNHEILYTFPNGSNDRYTMEFQTTAPKLEGNVNNSADFENPDSGKNWSSSTTVSVKHRDDKLQKSYQSNYVDGGKIHYRWKVERTIPNGTLSGFTYTDVIHDGVDGNGNEIPDSHYAIASELQRAIQEKLEMQIQDEDGKVQTIKWGENDFLSFSVTYYDAEGNVVEPNDTATHVMRFEITVTPKEGRTLEGIYFKISEYSTIVDYTGMDENETRNFVNTGSINDMTSDASHEHKKPIRIEKNTKVKDQWGNFSSYGSGEQSVNYDRQNGILYYEILLHTEENENGEIVLKDQIPDGATYVEDSLEAKFYANQWYQFSKLEWNDGKYDFENEQKPQVSVDSKTNLMTITIPAGYNTKKSDSANPYGNTIQLVYQISVKDDPYWKDESHEHKIYTNTVDWDGSKSDQTTEVTKDVEKLRKSATQLEEWDEATGEMKLIDKVRYTVVINPGAVDLHPDSDELSLTDNLTVPNGVDAHLDLTSVKLYQYDGEADDHLGKEVEKSRYSLTYNDESHKLEMKIPDEFACVLVYEYAFENKSSASEELTMTNEVSLDGQFSKKNELVAIDTTSAVTVDKNGELRFYKVDSENYSKLLSGAQFTLYTVDRGQTDVEKGWTEVGTFDTDKNGELIFKLRNSLGSDGVTIERNRLYKITETKAPDGYVKSDDAWYFVWMQNGNKIADSKYIVSNYNAWNFFNTWTGDPEAKNVTFYGGVDGERDGFYYVPNKNTQINVKKVWVDEENREVEPGSDKIRVQLYREEMECAGKPVKVIIRYYNTDKDNPEEMETEAYVKDSGTITVKALKYTWSDANTDPMIIKGGFTPQTPFYDATYGQNVVWYTKTFDISEIEGDTLLIPVGTGDWADRNYASLLKMEVTGDVETWKKADAKPYGDEVELSADNDWSYSWTVDATDSKTGQPYWYRVMEVGDLSGYTIIYNNNNGIQSGDILITNKKEIDFSLPETGGVGAEVIWQSGAILTALSGAGLGARKWRRMRKRDLSDRRR
ncbi:SpaA isopeptide-forming pilin-related protein [Brotaphodocola sp.]|uniref:SpaA isopeptide-forming pilin-related protein n=1 Tax=Brotaphodocola sp. TaxID=3073577 RepID=UPI003D7C7C2B